MGSVGDFVSGKLGGQNILWKYLDTFLVLLNLGLNVAYLYLLLYSHEKWGF